ncbi:MAG: hypothetical protein IIW49_08360, partial [Treponema sp.]|nr:hypothetical protein [Treponema sp.]
MKKSFFGKKILVKIFTLFVILNFNIFAETYTWNGSVSSNWNDAGNWDETSATPDGYNIILAKGTPYDVDFSTRNTFDFDSLVVESGVTIDIDTDITVENAFTNNGTVTVSGSGIIITCGSIENRGSFNFASNSVNCGDLQNRGTLSFTGNLDVTNNASFVSYFTNEGTVTVNNNATFSDTFTNKGNFSITGDGIFSSDVINDGGTISISKNASFSVSLKNDGTINCDTGDFTVTEFYSGTGNLSFTSGNATFSGAVTNNGTITCGTGALVVEGNYSGSGELTLSSGTSTFNGGTVNFSDVTLNHNNGTIVFDRASTGGMFSSDATINLNVNNTIFNNVKFGDTNNVKMTVDGNLIVEGIFFATSPTNFIGTEQTSTYKNITFSGSNKTISFAGKTQTITNLTATGTSGNEVLLTTDSASPSVNDNSTWWNVAGLTSGNVTLSNAKIEYSKSQNPLLITSLDVTENPEASTENWFLRKFYWFGKTDKNWNTASNWSSSGDSYVACPIAPSIDSGLSEITIVKNDTNILTLDSDINVKSFDVASSATVDFASYNVTSANGISNEGTIRLQGTSGQTFSAHTNEDGSTIEYYGNNFATFTWGTEYRNLKIAESIGGNYSGHILNVQEDLIIANNTLIMLKGTFARNVILGESGINAGSVTLTSSAQINVSGNCSNLAINGNLAVNNALSSGGVISVTGTTSSTGTISAGGDITFGGTADVAGVTSTSGVISFDGDATASGAISASGNITFSKNAIINEVTSTYGAISVGGTTSANGNITSAQSQTFSGAFTLNNSVTILAKENTVLFKDTVNGTHALTIGNNANATNVTFEKSVGSVNKLASLDVKGTITANEAIFTTGNIVVGGVANVTEVTSSGGAISVTGNATATGTISARGNITFGGNAIINEVTSSNGAISVGGTTSATGAISAGGVISFTGDATASGTISAQGDITFGANAIINEVTSSNGAISVTGTTSANGNITSAQSQTFNGAFTLNKTVTILSKNNTITFKDTVNGTYDLAIGNNANATNVTFEKSAGSTDVINSLFVKGNITANDKITTKGNISIGGTSSITSATSQSGAISLSGNAIASGAISASGNITFGKNANIYEVTSQNGAILVGGTTLANANITSAQSQTFNGAFTLQNDITFVASKVEFKGKVDSKAGSNYSATFGNETIKTSAAFHFSVGSSVPFGNITLNDASFSENASLIQTESSSLNVNGQVKFGKAQLQLGNLIISAGGNFTQTGVNTDSQSVCLIENNGRAIWDSTSLGGSVTLKGDVTGSNAPQVVFNKKNVIIGKDLNIAGVFYNLEIAPNINVTNVSGLCVRNNFTINGTYTHNDKKLTLGAITVAGKEYSSGDEGKISGSVNVALGTVEIVQQGTPKNIAISGSIFELIMNNANSTGKISV